MVWAAVATEDEPSEEVAVRLVAHGGGEVHLRLRRNGFGYLKANLERFAEIARTYPVLVLTDLDHAHCPAEMKREWCAGLHLPPGFHLRIAVRECEAWLLADREGICEYLGVAERYCSDRPEAIADPKQALLRLAMRAPRRIRDDMVRRDGDVLVQGLGYSMRMAEFARDRWNLELAMDHSPSLRRAATRLQALAA